MRERYTNKVGLWSRTEGWARSHGLRGAGTGIRKRNRRMDLSRHDLSQRREGRQSAVPRFDTFRTLRARPRGSTAAPVKSQRTAGLQQQRFRRRSPPWRRGTRRRPPNDRANFRKSTRRFLTSKPPTQRRYHEVRRSQRASVGQFETDPLPRERECGCGIENSGDVTPRRAPTRSTVRP